MTRHAVPILGAPFPFFGGKGRVAPLVWSRFGTVTHYIEPFAGSLATLLARPLPFEGSETVNDADGLIVNFWRALKSDPDGVAHHADWPVLENCLHARHAWLVGRKESLQARLEGDPEFHDVKVAGWWVWGICCWIGSGWCSSRGPWRVVDGEFINTGASGGNRRKLVHLGDAGRGMNRQLVNLGNAGRGMNRERVPAGDGEEGACAAWSGHLAAMMNRLADRLRRVRVCCGDWTRVCGGKDGDSLGHLTRDGNRCSAIFLDPPYAEITGRDPRLYGRESPDVAHAVRAWALAHGDDPRFRIALCGYEGEHAMPETWECVPWKARGGYGSQARDGGNPNAARERVWFSPHCLGSRRRTPLFDLLDEGKIEGSGPD